MAAKRKRSTDSSEELSKISKTEISVQEMEGWYCCQCSYLNLPSAGRCEVCSHVLGDEDVRIRKAGSDHSLIIDQAFSDLEAEFLWLLSEPEVFAQAEKQDSEADAKSEDVSKTDESKEKRNEKGNYYYEGDAPKTALEHETDEMHSVWALEEMIRKGTAMHCPQCNIVIIKNKGCDFVKCKMCKTGICWATKGFRYGPKGCGCTKQNKCHPHCRGCH